VREARIAQVDARAFDFKRWTSRRYYEACTSPKIYQYLEKSKAAAAAVMAR
jgi:hypothetical protein